MTRPSGRAPGAARKRETAEYVAVWAAVLYAMPANEMVPDAAARFLF